MQRGQVEAAALDAEPGKDLFRVDTLREEADRVEHDVADDLYAVRDALARQVLGGDTRGAEQHTRDVVHDDPVDLLGHRAVEGAEPRLDVDHGDAQLHGGQPAGERRVRVPVHEHRAGLLLDHELLEHAQHLAGLPAVTAGADPEVEVGCRDAELLEEDVGHTVVVVLTRVDEDLIVPLAQGAAYRRRLDELRPGSDDREDSHVPPTPSSLR